MHEMPDLFKIGDWWYHIVTEYSDRSKMVYRMSKSLEGPWIAPKDDAFDGRAYYAGRTFELNGQRLSLIHIYHKLGFETAFETVNEEADEKVVFLKLGTLVVEVYENHAAVLRAGAIDHVALDVKDIEEIYQYVNQAGLNTTPVSYTHLDVYKRQVYEY